MEVVSDREAASKCVTWVERKPTVNSRCSNIDTVGVRKITAINPIDFQVTFWANLIYYINLKMGVEDLSVYH